MNRFTKLVVLAALICASVAWTAAQTAETPKVQLNSAGAGPRQVEDATEKAVARDYANAWRSMSDALRDNRTDLVDTDFVGTAQDSLKARIADQTKSGLHIQYVDRGHQLQAVFYSPEGSAMQLRDVAQGEIQILDGDKVIHSETVRKNYLVVMTAAENRWKVRMLQQVTEF